MKIMILTSSPNKDGLTASCGNIAEAAAKEAGAETLQVNLNDLNMGSCHACGNGWGPCLSKHECQVLDDFQTLHKNLKEYDAFVIVTPVYWGDMSESAKVFFDRVRRCEAWKEDNAFLQNKPVISIAAAGGSGNGILPCLTNIERLLTHVKAERFDYIGITRRNKEYKLAAIHSSVKTLVSYLNNK